MKRLATIRCLGPSDPIFPGLFSPLPLSVGTWKTPCGGWTVASPSKDADHIYSSWKVGVIFDSSLSLTAHTRKFCQSHLQTHPLPHPQCSLDRRETPPKPVSRPLYSHTQSPKCILYSATKGIFWKHISVHNRGITENHWMVFSLRE